MSDQEIINKAINPTSLQDFKTHLHGELIVPEGEAQVRTSYGATYERLACVKNAYDPTNFFHLNHNIRPTGDR